MLAETLEITSVKDREYGNGTWVSGKVDGYKFQCLVFSDHAECEEYELNGTKISKLWIRRESDKATVFNFDRGIDVPAADGEVEQLIELIAEGVGHFA